MTRDTIGLMDALGIDKAHLVGHSTGGAIGQVMAVEHPGRLLSMVVYASWVTSDPFMRRVMNSRKQLALNGGAKAYAEATPIYLFPDWWINQNAAWVEELDRKTVAGFPPPSIAASRCGRRRRLRSVRRSREDRDTHTDPLRTRRFPDAPTIFRETWCDGFRTRRSS